ncbi:MAG: response regulator transcription factor [Anaerolineae bacterium]|nr:response regulator transcription factor [Anaerolineae bacterium]
MAEATILVVDDEPRLLRLVNEVLTAVGYRVVTANNGEAALDTFALEQPDLILLDIHLPHSIDGYEVCRRIREFSDVPVIMLTAKARESDLLRGFEAGADDYLTKPFSAKELLARVKAVLRRYRSPEEIRTTLELACGELRIHFAQRRVFVGTQEVKLTPTEYQLLRVLALNANKVMLHQDLLTQVWGPEYRDDIDYLRAYIRSLRQKLEEDPHNPKHILTTPRVGYMLACPEEN